MRWITFAGIMQNNLGKKKGGIPFVQGRQRDAERGDSYPLPKHFVGRNG